MTEDEASADQAAGLRLKELRTDAGLTQAELADLAGIERSRYNALERGRMTITTTYAERLAPALKLGDPSLLLPSPEPAQPTQTLGELLLMALANQDAAIDLLEALQGSVEDAAAGARANGARLDRVDASLAELRRTLEPQRRRRGSA